MTDSTQEMFERAARGFLPAAARTQIVRLLNGEDVSAYVIQDKHDLASSQGLNVRRRLAILTPTRLLHVAWAESVVESDEDEDDEDATFARLTREMSGTLEEPPTPVLEVLTRTLRLGQIVDVDVNTRYERGSIDPTWVAVLILLPTLNAFQTMPLDCGEEEECTGIHGTHGQAMQDAIAFTMSSDDFSTEDIDALAQFAEAVASALR